MIHNVIEHIEEKNGSKYLVFNSTYENKEVLKQYTELWDGIKNEVETINGAKACDCEKDFIKIKFTLHDNLRLNKQLKFSTMTIVVRHVFEEDGKYYLQI